MTAASSGPHRKDSDPPVLNIFAQGTRDNPRAVYQARHVFQVRWAVLCARSLKQPADPELLAALAMLEYAWDDVYQSVYAYPELFFYLHALANSRPNRYVRASEIDEIRILGLARAGETLTLLERYKDPELARLLSALSLTTLHDVNHLLSHMTLTDEVAPTGVLLQDPADALLSGDPVLVRFATRVANPLLDLLPMLSAELADVRPDSPADEIARAAQVVFALGRIPDGPAGDLLLDLGRSADSLPIPVLKRVVYALSHHALDLTATRRDQAIDVLAAMANNESLSDGVRSQILWPWRHMIYTDSQIDSLLYLLDPERKSSTSRLLRLSAKTVLAHSLLNLAQVMPRLKSLSESWPDFRTLLRVALDAATILTRDQKLYLPKPLRQLLFTLAGREGAQGDEVLTILQTASDPGAVMRWLTVVFLKYPDRRKACLNHLGHVQRQFSCWAHFTWRKVLETVRTAPDLEEDFIRALGDTMKSEAAQLLGELHRSLPERILQSLCCEWLTRMREAGVKGAAQVLGTLDCS